MANNSSMIRKLDALGRIVLPREIRNQLSAEEGSSFSVDLIDGKIVLELHQPTCIFCGSDVNLREFKGKTVCSKCARELNK